MTALSPTQRRSVQITTRLAAIASLTGLAGCPQGALDDRPVQPRITLSATRGPAPLRVAVSAAESTAIGASIVAYAWDFAGLATAAGPEAVHLFEAPGRYRITLTLTDSLNRVATTVAEVRAEGGSATAVLAAAPAGGVAPLLVHFDGNESSAGSDAILDYYWNFGDGAASREAAPVYVYTRPGTFTVTLRVVSGGGAQDTVQATIVVSPSPEG
mgnify:CR=1 FL=1